MDNLLCPPSSLNSCTDSCNGSIISLHWCSNGTLQSSARDSWASAHKSLSFVLCHTSGWKVLMKSHVQVVLWVRTVLQVQVVLEVQVVLLLWLVLLRVWIVLRDKEWTLANLLFLCTSRVFMLGGQTRPIALVALALLCARKCYLFSPFVCGIKVITLPSTFLGFLLCIWNFCCYDRIQFLISIV